MARNPLNELPLPLPLLWQILFFTPFKINVLQATKSQFANILCLPVFGNPTDFDLSGFGVKREYFLYYTY